MAEMKDAGDTTPAKLPVLRLTPAEWRRVLGRRGFLDFDDNRFQAPRRLHGRSVQIVPDDSFR